MKLSHPVGPGDPCVCASAAEGTGFCVDGDTPCDGLPHCSSSSDCISGEVCAVKSCCEESVCVGQTFCSGSSLPSPFMRDWRNATMATISKLEGFW